MKQTRIDLIGIVFLIIAMLTWASSFVALKAVLGELGPMSAMFGRMVIAALCFVYFIKQFRLLTFTKRDVKYILLLTFFEPCLYFIFEANSLRFTTASQAGMITSMMPLMTAIAASFVLKEYLSKRVVIGSALAVAGAVWLSLGAQSSEHASDPLLGNFLEFCAMICATWYTISVRYLSQKFSALFLTAIQTFIGTLFFFPLAVWESWGIPLNLTWETLWWLAYLGIVVTLGGYGMFNLALSRIEASRASVFVNLIPVFTILLAYFFLGEVLSQTEMMASCVIFGGIIISQLPRFRAKDNLL